MNKYSFVFALLSLLPFSIIAQSQSSIDFSFGTGVSSGSEYRGADKNKRNLNINLTYSKPLSEHFIISTGLEYSIHTFSRISNYFGINDSIGTSGMDIDVIIVDEESGIQLSHKFYGVPLSCRYEGISKKLNPFVEAGASLNYYSRSDLVSRSENKSKINVFGMIAIGANYQITDDYKVFTRFRYNAVFNSIDKASFNGNNTNSINVNHRLHDFGIALGVRKLLNVVDE